MGDFVVNSAQIKCDKAVPPGTSVLSVLPANRVDAGAMSAATVMDFTPTNISTFGMCNTQTNPAVAAATSAALGTPTPAPCVPVIVGPWSPGAAKTTINGFKALTKDSTCKCAWMGEVSIQSEGQVKASVG